MARRLTVWYMVPKADAGVNLADDGMATMSNSYKEANALARHQGTYIVRLDWGRMEAWDESRAREYLRGGIHLAEHKVSCVPRGVVAPVLEVWGVEVKG
jgi:hypothetical protein